VLTSEGWSVLKSGSLKGWSVLKSYLSVVSFFGLVCALGPVRVAPGGLTEDADEYRDGDYRDHDQDEQGYDC